MKKKTFKIIAFSTLAAGGLVFAFLNLKKNDSDDEIEEYTSPYFTFSDMFRSSKAIKKGISNTTNDVDILKNIVALFKNILDPARKQISFSINSGFRTDEVNKLVDGASSSQHKKGEAADLTTGTKDGNKKLYNIIKSFGNFDQLINEKDYSWIHVSYKRVGYNRGQELVS